MCTATAVLTVNLQDDRQTSSTGEEQAIGVECHIFIRDDTPQCVHKEYIYKALECPMSQSCPRRYKMLVYLSEDYLIHVDITGKGYK